MRLIDIRPLLCIKNSGLPRTKIGLVRQFLATGERLKVCEQKLNYLKRRKLNKVFPPFIINNVHVNQSILFPESCPQSVCYYERVIRVNSLNQHIRLHYNSITSNKENIQHLKSQLREQISDQMLYTKILSVADAYNWRIKQDTKHRLQRKYDWLIAKYYPKSRIHLSMGHRVAPISEHVENRITILPHENLQLTDEEKSILALGPKFAIAPQNKDKIKEDFDVDLAHTAIKLRRRMQFDNSEDNLSASVNNNQTDTVNTENIVNNTQNEAINLTDSTTEANAEESVYGKLKKMGCKIQTPYFNVPQVQDTVTEEKLRRLHHDISKIIEESELPKNLTQKQCKGFKSLNQRTDIDISVSDKGGEFVVCKASVKKTVTINHLKSTKVYKWIPPTRKYKGVEQPVKKPTTTTYNNQINTKTTELELKFNNLWYGICQRNDSDYKTQQLLASHSTSLPCLYVQIKTHKIPVDQDFDNLDLEMLKLRPIISCSGSAGENLAWLVAKILQPLLAHIPHHLQNTYEHISLISAIPPEELQSLQLYTADICSLYTNLSDSDV